MSTFRWSRRKRGNRGGNNGDSATIAENNSNTREHGNAARRQRNGLPNWAIHCTGALGTGDTGVCNQWENNNE